MYIVYVIRQKKKKTREILSDFRYFKSFILWIRIYYVCLVILKFKKDEKAITHNSQSNNQY